jgi:uncharacterized FlaG/YvyC family protein
MNVDFRPATPAAVPPSGGPARAERRPEPKPEPPEFEAPREEAQAETDRALSAALERIGRVGPNVDARLSIVQDDITRDFVYRIMNTRTGEIVRQFPHEKMVELLRFLSEQQGLVVDTRV